MMKFLITVIACAIYQSGFAQQGRIILLVKEIQVSKSGQLSVGIFSKEDFLSVGKQLMGKEVPVKKTTQQVVFEDVPPGTYGVAVFQDINKDSDLATNFVGFPREPIGFSNNARIKFGPPSFSDASFTIEAGKTATLEIILR